VRIVHDRVQQSLDNIPNYLFAHYTSTFKPPLNKSKSPCVSTILTNYIDLSLSEHHRKHPWSSLGARFLLTLLLRMAIYR
jgi:hypothetical protein